jgi:hypothetical protein
MQRPTTPWEPVSGDTVRLKDSGLIGTVIQTKGVYERRFRVKVPRPAAGGDPVETKRAAAAATRASRWYGLDELEATS